MTQQASLLFEPDAQNFPFLFDLPVPPEYPQQIQIYDPQVHFFQHPEPEYQSNLDTIITWIDPGTDRDVALSFQNPTGANEVWDLICAIQDKDPNEPRNDQQSEDDQSISLPTIENLASTAQEFSQLNFARRVLIVKALNEENYEYIRELGRLLKESHQKQDIKSLTYLFYIYKGIICTADQNLIEVLMSDQFYLDTFLALNYDPESMQKQKRIDNRDFFQNKLVFKRLEALKDPNFLYRIHLNYRISYLKDTAMTKLLQDQTVGTITRIIYLNNCQILNHVLRSPQIAYGVIELLMSENPRDQLKGIDFLNELCSMSRSMKLEAETWFFGQLNSLKFLDYIMEIIVKSTKLDEQRKASQREEGQASQEEKGGQKGNFEDIIASEPNQVLTVDQRIDHVVTELIDILENCAKAIPSQLVNYLKSPLQEQKGFPFLQNLTHLMLRWRDEGVKLQILEFFRSIYDKDAIKHQTDFFLITEKHVFLPCLKFIENPEFPLEIAQSDETEELINSSYHIIFEFFQFLVRVNLMKTRKFFYQNKGLQILSKVLFYDSFKPLTRPKRHVQLDYIRLVKNLLEMKCELCQKYIAAHNIIPPIVKLIKANFPHSNMLESLGIKFLQAVSESRKMSLIQQAVGDNEQFLQNFYPRILDIRNKQKEYNSSTMERGVQPIPSESKKGDFDEDEDYFGKLDDEDLNLQFQNIIPDYDMFAGNSDFEEVASRRNESAFQFEEDDAIDFRDRFNDEGPPISNKEEKKIIEKGERDILEHEAMVFELEHDSGDKPDVRFV